MQLHQFEWMMSTGELFNSLTFKLLNSAHRRFKKWYVYTGVVTHWSDVITFIYTFCDGLHYCVRIQAATSIEFIPQ